MLKTKQAIVFTISVSLDGAGKYSMKERIKDE